MNGYKAGDQIFVKSSWCNVTLPSIDITIYYLYPCRSYCPSACSIYSYILKLSHKYGLKRIKNH